MKKIIRLTEQDLYRIIKESIDNMINNTKSNREMLNNVCFDIDSPVITLYFEDVDEYYITKNFNKRFKHKIPSDIKDVDFYAKYFNNKSDDDCCILGYLSFDGYGVTPNYLCNLTIDEFLKFFNNFKYKDGRFVRNSVVKY